MAKKIKKLVVDATYFNLIVRKASLLDEMVENSGGGAGLAVYADSIKTLDRIQKDWNRVGGDFLAGTEEPYEEPKAKK